MRSNFRSPDLVHPLLYPFSSELDRLLTVMQELSQKPRLRRIICHSMDSKRVADCRGAFALTMQKFMPCVVP